MNRKKMILLAISLALMLIFSFNVFAQEELFKLSNIFEPLQGFDIAETYSRFPVVIDSIIYFIFFISIAQVTLGRQFEGRGGRGLVIAVGLALSVAISFWAQKTGFTLGRLGPLAATLIVITVGILIYRFLKGDQKAGSAIWIAILIGWVAIYVYFPELIASLQENRIGRFFLAILNITFIIALPMFIYTLFKGGGREDSDSGRWGGLLPRGRGPAPTRYRQTTLPRRGPTRANLRGQARYARRVADNVNEMEMHYATLQGICNSSPGGIIPINQAIAYTIRRIPGTLNPAQIGHLNANRTQLNRSYRNYVDRWNNLYRNIHRIARLNPRLRGMVIRQLRRRI